MTLLVESGCFEGLGVSKNNGTPQIINFNRVFHYKPSILRCFPLFLGFNNVQHPFLSCLGTFEPTDQLARVNNRGWSRWLIANSQSPTIMDVNGSFSQEPNLQKLVHVFLFFGQFPIPNYSTQKVSCKMYQDVVRSMYTCLFWTAGCVKPIQFVFYDVDKLFWLTFADGSLDSMAVSIVTLASS